MSVTVTDFKPILDAVFRDVVPLLGHMGVEVEVAEPGHCVTRLPHRAENGNHIGTVYAGALFSFLEASGGALVLCSLDVSKWVPVIVEGTIRYLRPVTGSITADLSLPPDEREALASSLESDPKMRWTLTARATAESGETACEADLVYRFKRPG